MIHRIWALAQNTYREAIRQKVLYGLALFGGTLILFSLFLGQLTLGADTKIVQDVGLASMMIFGAMLAIFMGVGLVFKEVERRTIYTILSKPVSRVEFILGKFFGLSMTIAVEVVAMTILLFAMLSLYPDPLNWNLLKAVLLIFSELCVLVAVALVFSSYSSSFMSIVFCLSFLLLGHVTDDFAGIMRPKAYLLIREGTAYDHWAGQGLLGLVNLLEMFSLDHLSINAKVVHGVPVSWAWVATGFYYALCWIVLLLSLAIWFFRRKDLQ